MISVNGVGELDKQAAVDTPTLGATPNRWLDDEDPQIQAYAAKNMGDRDHIPAVAKLVALLKSPHSAVQFQAAIALGKSRFSQASYNFSKPLFELLRTNANRDKYLRHAAVYGLSLTGDLKAVRAHLDDPDPAARTRARERLPP